MCNVRRTTLSCLIALAVACGAKDDPLLALTGSQTLPDQSTLDPSDPRYALGALDGVSPVAPALVETGVQLDPTSVAAGTTVRVFEFDDGSGLGYPTDFVGELAASEFAAIGLGSAVVVLPLQPLSPRACFVVVLTGGIRDLAGNPLRPSHNFAALSGNAPAGLPAFRLVRAARVSGLRLQSIARVQSMQTQGVREVLAAVHQSTQARPVQLAFTGLSTDQLGVPGGADIYVGTIEVPMYTDPTDPLGSYWKTSDGGDVDSEHPQPALRAVLAIPVILTVPNADSGRAKPADGWDIVIYQHGITRVRTDMLAVAGSMASAGLATIAIDLPLHGVTDPSNPFYQSGRERTYDLDLVDNVTLAPGPDGIIDDSGTFFINLGNLLNFRDNGRQAVSDLFTLTRSIPQIDYDGGGADFDDVSFFGGSLGGILGVPYLAIEDGVGPASLGMVGGGVARLLQASVFGDLVDAGLAAQGIFPGTPEYEFFYNAMQTVIDGGDPVNFAREAAERHPIHLMQMRNDPVVPNAVPGWPLSGSEPLASLMGLQTITATVFDPSGVRGFVTFTDAFGISHQPQLEPGVSPRVTVEMVGSMVTFLASGGVLLPVNDAGAIE